MSFFRSPFQNFDSNKMLGQRRKINFVIIFDVLCWAFRIVVAASFSLRKNKFVKGSFFDEQEVDNRTPRI